jgi:hypothetical protein
MMPYYLFFRDNTIKYYLYFRDGKLKGGLSPNCKGKMRDCALFSRRENGALSRFFPGEAGRK